MTPTALIVDPASSGGHMAPAFTEKGWQAIAVLSEPDRPVVLEMPEHYHAVVQHEGDIGQTLAALRPFSPRCVIAGFETAIALADLLSDGFKLPGNDPVSSAIRRSKPDMYAAVEAAGIPTAKQFRVQSRDELKTRLTTWTDWPLVLKPAESAGSDSVQICATLDECLKAFDKVFNLRNKLGGLNTELVCQAFLDGQQYLVNTMSFDGCHYVAEIWQFNTIQRDGIPLYDTQYLLDPRTALSQAIVAYTLRVLDALEIRFGPAHTEVIVTKDGPRLIETAARLPGKVARASMGRALGHDLIGLYLDYSMSGGMKVNNGQTYSIREDAGIAALRVPSDGVLGTQAAIEELRALQTFSECIGIDLYPGQSVSQTVDLFTCPGLLYFVGKDMSKIIQDIEKVREIETEGGLYVAC